MRTLAVLPIKSFHGAKQRLAGLLGGGSRQALAQAMFLDVLASLRRVPGVEAIAVVTGDPRAQAAAAGGAGGRVAGARGPRRVVVLDDPEETGQSAAAAVGVRHAAAAGFERALLVPGDTPLLDPVEVDGLLARSAADAVGVAIVPDRHGTGTNALLLRPPEAIEPSFGPDSLGRHVAAAEAAGVVHRVEALPTLLHDVDTPDDLAELSALLERRRGSAPTTRGALRQLDRAHVAGATAHRRERRQGAALRAGAAER